MKHLATTTSRAALRARKSNMLPQHPTWRDFMDVDFSGLARLCRWHLSKHSCASSASRLVRYPCRYRLRAGPSSTGICAVCQCALTTVNSLWPFLGSTPTNPSRPVYSILLSPILEVPGLPMPATDYDLTRIAFLNPSSSRALAAIFY
jgi:hypothetical protein